MKACAILLIFLLLAPINAVQSDVFPSVKENVFYEYHVEPSGTNISACAIIYFDFRIEIENVTKTPDRIVFDYWLYQYKYVDGNLTGTYEAIFHVNVSANTSEINGWFFNTMKLKEALLELLYGFAGFIGADVIGINETTYEFNGQNRSVYYGYFYQSNGTNYGRFIIDKEYGILLERIVVIEEQYICVQQFDVIERMVLRDTNLFSRLNLSKELVITLAFMSLAVVIVLLFIVKHIRRK